MFREDFCFFIFKNYIVVLYIIVIWCDYSVSLILMRREGVFEFGKRGKEGVGCEFLDFV